MRFGPEDMTPPPEHDLSATAQQERKPHTEEQVRAITQLYRRADSATLFSNEVRRILGVPAPKETP